MRTITRPAWIEISVKALAHNVSTFRRLIPEQTSLMAVVKANAYGHGELQVARVALANGAASLGVAQPEEGLRLRRDGIGVPILVLGTVRGKQLDLCVTKDLTPTIYLWDTAVGLSNLARKLRKTVRVQIKVDTGMGRFGVLPSQVPDFVRKVKGLPFVEVQGIYTHFATADEPQKDYFASQLAIFNQVLQELEDQDLRIPLRHCANTAATLKAPKAHMDLVRVGLGLYGLSPFFDPGVDLRGALSLKAEVLSVKRVPPHTAVSYGSTYVTKKETSIAVLPLGYGDGVSRLLGNKGRVLLHGRSLPIVGRVCMDAIMIDVGDLEVQEGDEAVLIGTQGDERITIDDWAEIMGTINYEVPCLFTSRLPRVYV